MTLATVQQERSTSEVVETSREVLLPAEKDQLQNVSDAGLGQLWTEQQREQKWVCGWKRDVQVARGFTLQMG